MPAKNQSIIYLMAINVLIFIASTWLKFEPLQSLALYFPLNEKFALWQLVTHMFMHGSVAHILFNMYALWSFGTPLEQTWKTPRFLAFYFVTGLGAALIYTVANYYQFSAITNDILTLGYSTNDIQTILQQGMADGHLVQALGKDRLVEFMSIYHAPVVGASGAMYGVLVAFAMRYPDAKLSLIFLPVPISAKWFVPLIIAGDLFFGLTKYSVGNIAHFAHVGGAITALVIMLVVRYRQKQ
ncbi:Rhomboid protease GluP [Shewanella sp. P1-14-1]|uniref:rhomboid family intramembrane serine protease n=1 Tax=Shewanella sp. P1-14-1 TaxID=1723761 RepID=UPI0006D68D07|nr:rhomboid family intramembrane serine protease [Shewanella sp. P1-14-1]KPZ67401.1 Rhomboid protease GluP [Shewanella sp. P1-14-1]